MHEYDNRYLWMNLKRIIGSHFANYREAWEANELINRGPDPPDAVQDVRPGGRRARPRSTSTATPHQGKVGVLTLAPEEGLGVTDPAKRQRHLAAINRFRNV